MKNLTKLFSMMSVVMMASIMLISCGMKATPEESTKIYFNALLKDDKTGIDKIGMKEEDFDKIKKDDDDKIMAFFSASGLGSDVVTDDVKNTFKDNVLKGMSKADFEVTPDSTDKETAKVNVKVKVFDMDKIIKDAQDKITGEYLANTSMSQKDVLQESFKIIGQEFADGTFKDDTKTVSITLNKKDNVWQPDDNGKAAVLNAIIGEE